MSSTTKNKQIDMLRQRALRRHISFPGNKNIKDVQIENISFDEMKYELYKQIASDFNWN